jgi:hypothetical protein
MGYANSTLYTIGTALSRAEQLGTPVEVLVAGQWLSGRIVATDGMGLVLNSEDEEHSVVRMESISAVRIFTPAPVGPQIAAAEAIARPMPCPRSA